MHQGPTIKEVEKYFMPMVYSAVFLPENLIDISVLRLLESTFIGHHCPLANNNM